MPWAKLFGLTSTSRLGSAVNDIILPTFTDIFTCASESACDSITGEYRYTERTVKNKKAEKIPKFSVYLFTIS